MKTKTTLMNINLLKWRENTLARKMERRQRNSHSEVTVSYLIKSLKCIWQIFFICSIKFPQCADKCSKTIFSIAIFLPHVLMCPKRQISLPVGYKNRDAKNRRLGTIVTSIQDSKPGEKQISQSFSYCELINLLRNGTVVRCLWENKKTSEKSVFREAWSPELMSQSFSVPCFWSHGFVPHRKWNLLLVHQNTGKENRYGKNFFATLISTLGRFNRANKKNLSYTL